MKAKKAAIGQWNPHWSAMQQADARISHLESKLGLDPISRGKDDQGDSVARGKQGPQTPISRLRQLDPDHRIR